MKEYTFYAYFLNGSGRIFPLSDWTFDNTVFFVLGARDLTDSDSVKFCFENSSSGMFQVKVLAYGFREAMYYLKNSLTLNRLDLVLSPSYDCLSNGTLSRRKIRSSHLILF